MNERAPLPPAIRHRPFAVSEAREHGVTRNRVQASDLCAPYLGTRAHGPPTTTEERASAYRPLLAADQCFSHVTAAVLWWIPLPAGHEHDTAIDVTTGGPGRRVRRPGVRGHRATTDVAAVRLRGFAVTDPVRTWIALGSVLGTDDLVIAGDALVGWLRLATVEDLRAAVDHSRRVRGVRRLRLALDEIRPGSQSPAETRVRLVLIRNGLPEPELNYDVIANGRKVARVDLAYPDARIAIEYDSDLHRTNPESYRIDLTRSEHLKDVDWWPVRVTAHDVGPGSDAFVARIRRLLDAGRRGSHRPT